MSVKVVFTTDVLADLRSQRRQLLAGEREGWAERLFEEVEAVGRLLSHSPRAGPVEVRRGGREIRRLVTRSLPFVLWFYFRTRSRKVVVLRLFYVRQSREM